jgi:hypothetical protein
MRPTPRRLQKALEKDATLRLARFERAECWEGLSAGDPVRIAGHRGGKWLFRAFVTNTSNGASWVEVSEVMASARRSAAAVTEADGDGEGGGTTMTRVRSFPPEQVVPLRRSRRRRPAAAVVVELPVPIQVSLFDLS